MDGGLTLCACVLKSLILCPHNCGKRTSLHEMMTAGAVRLSQIPYSSNLVIILKNDGRMRFCVDFRKLINKTIKMPMQYPIISQFGYWKVEVNEEDKQTTTFQVGNLRFYKFNRMPFGLCNASASFQRTMESVWVIS